MCSWSLLRVEGSSGHWDYGRLWLMSEIVTVTLNKNRWSHLLMEQIHP